MPNTQRAGRRVQLRRLLRDLYRQGELPKPPVDSNQTPKTKKVVHVIKIKEYKSKSSRVASQVSVGEREIDACSATQIEWKLVEVDVEEHPRDPRKATYIERKQLDRVQGQATRASSRKTQAIPEGPAVSAKGA